MPDDCIYDPDCRVVGPRRLREETCGWPMLPSRDGKHVLVYRCDATRCGSHTAHIADIEAGLLREYRQHLSARDPESWMIADEHLIDWMYTHLDLAWARNGYVRQARFAIPLAATQHRIHR